MANETKWTPGPWKADAAVHSNGKRFRCVREDRAHGNCWEIAKVYSSRQGPDTTDATALFIAAAPDLYAALECVLPLAEKWAEAEHQSHPVWNDIREARAALALARGEKEEG